VWNLFLKKKKICAQALQIDWFDTIGSILAYLFSISIYNNYKTLKL